MKVFSIGSDRKLFENNSAVQKRQIEYAKLFDEVHILVFSKKSNNYPKRLQISENCWVYSTDSLSRLLYVFDASRLGYRIVSDLGEGVTITCQDPFESGLVGVKIAKKTKTKLQIQIHTDFLSPYFKKMGILNRFRVICAYKVLPKADTIRVVSQRIKDSFLKDKKLRVCGPKIKVLPIFVDKDKILNSSIKVNLKQKYPQFDFVVLSMSRLSEEKNIYLGILAFAEFLKTNPNSGLIIVGFGPEEGNLKSLVKKMSLEKNIIFEKWTEDPVSYQKSADIFLLTSWYEGYGLTIAESIISGVPVVSTDVGLAPGILSGTEYSFVCKPRDLSCLSKKILLLKKDEKLKKQLVSEAQNRLENQLLSKEEYLEEYGKLI